MAEDQCNKQISFLTILPIRLTGSCYPMQKRVSLLNYVDNFCGRKSALLFLFDSRCANHMPKLVKEQHELNSFHVAQSKPSVSAV